MKRALAIMAVLVAVCLVSLAFGASSSTTTTGDVAVGSVTGTGANINVSIGFTPRYVVVTNPTTTSPVRAEWFSGMTSGSCLKSVASGTSGSNVSGVAIVTNPTNTCIGTYAGSTTAAKGFTIQADSNLNISGNTLYYRAER